MTLECGVEKDASVVVTWRWFVGDHEMSLSDSRMSLNSADGTLTIKSVRITDVGRYTCHVVSVAGNDSASAELEVIGMFTSVFVCFCFCVKTDYLVHQIFSCGCSFCSRC